MEYAELDSLSEKIKNKPKQAFISKWEVFKIHLKNNYSSLNSVSQHLNNFSSSYKYVVRDKVV